MGLNWLRLAGLLLAVAPTAQVSVARAQLLQPGPAAPAAVPERTPPVPQSPPAPAPAVPCASGAAVEWLPAIDAARELLAAAWLATERGLFAAYTMAGEIRNPFDLAPAAPPSGPRSGMVQVKATVCTIEARGAGEPLRIRFVAPLFRFHELGRWSPPMRDGLVMEFEASPLASGDWQLRDVAPDKAILEPDQKPRRPEATELPRSGRWPEPIPGCQRTERWDGDACVPRKRAKA